MTNEAEMTNDQLIRGSGAEDEVPASGVEIFPGFVVSHSFVIGHWSFVI
jgi:hypothetical protein